MVSLLGPRRRTWHQARAERSQLRSAAKRSGRAQSTTHTVTQAVPYSTVLENLVRLHSHSHPGSVVRRLYARAAPTVAASAAAASSQRFKKQRGVPSQTTPSAALTHRLADLTPMACSGRWLGQQLPYARCSLPQAGPSHGEQGHSAVAEARLNHALPAGTKYRHGDARTRLGVPPETHLESYPR